MVVFKDNIAEVDSPHVKKLREAGVVFVGRSNTPAFSYRWFTDNDLHGRTLNPWDDGRTPGGRVAARARQSPAACCRSPTAMTSVDRSATPATRAVSLAFGRRSVGCPAGMVPRTLTKRCRCRVCLLRDLSRVRSRICASLSMLCPASTRDPFTVPVPLASNNQPLPRPIRVGLLRDVGVATPQPAVNDALDTAARWLTDAGYVVEEIELPLLEEAYRLWYLLAMEEFRQIMPLVEEIGDEGMKRAAATYYTAAKDWWGEKPGLEAYMNGYARRGTLIGRLQAFMQDYPLVLLPVSAEQAFEHDADISSIESGLRVVAAQWSMMAIPTLGFPAVSVPTGVANELPVGVQLLGRRFREDTVLDAAEVVEARSGVLTPIDPR